MITALGEKLERAGVAGPSRLYVTATDVLGTTRNFDAAVLAFTSRVRSDATLMREVCRSYLQDVAADMRGESLGGEGHDAAAGKASLRAPIPSRSYDDAGLTASADKAIQPVPASSPNAAAGHPEIAAPASDIVPAAASRHAPGHSRRGLRAINSVQEAVSKSLFDTIILPDGRRLRSVRWSETEELAGRYRRLSRILLSIRLHGTPADPNMTVDQLLSEEKLAQMVSAVEAVNDVA